MHFLSQSRSVSYMQVIWIIWSCELCSQKIIWSMHTCMTDWIWVTFHINIDVTFGLKSATLATTPCAYLSLTLQTWDIIGTFTRLDMASFKHAAIKIYVHRVHTFTVLLPWKSHYKRCNRNKSFIQCMWRYLFLTAEFLFNHPSFSHNYDTF